jgi:hypothetical protein
MKVTFITTVGFNVGDDFVRDGISYLLREACGPFEARLVHKHFPVSARAGFQRWHTSALGARLLRLPGLRRPGRLSRLLDAFPLNSRTDAILSCDVLVQSGAPVYWLNASGACEANEWYGPLIVRRWRRRNPRPPLLNLGAGACQPFASDGSEFVRAPATLAFIRDFFSECSLTTVRDQLSQEILAHANRTAVRLLCPSVFARRWYAIEPTQGDYIALNFMACGGHYDLDGQIDRERWRATFAEVLAVLSRSERCVLVCHDREEEGLARRWFPEVERFHSSEPADYLRFYAGARSGVLNRVHGAFALASFGRPAVIVGADSRARMGEELGLPVLPASTATAAAILSAHAEARRDEAGFGLRTAELAQLTERRYGVLLRHALPNFSR